MIKVQRLIFLLTMMIGIQANAIGRLQDADFKTLTQITNAGGTAASLLNDSKIYVGANGINQTLNSAIASGLIGGGAGINLVSNGSFEASGIAGWATFQTTLSSLVPSSAPATCASCSITVTANTAAPLNGKASLQLTAASAVTAGQGFISGAFTVQPAYQGQVVTIKGVNSLVSGAPVLAGDATNTFAIYAYDVTNSAWIQPSGTYGISSKGGPFAPVSFQIPSNTTSMRLAVVAVNALASPTTLLFDDLAVAPGLNGLGLAGADFKITGPIVVGGTTTAPSKGGGIVVDQLGYSRIGDSARVIAQYKHTTAGVAGSGDYLYTLPSGLAFDLNKVPVYTTIIGNGLIATPVCLGSAQLSNTDSSASGCIIPYNATQFRIALISTNGSASGRGVHSVSVYSYNNTPISVAFDFLAPIAGWSTNVTQSSDYDGRNVNYYGTQSAGVGENINFPMSSTADRAGAWSNTLNAYVVQAAGDYLVSATTYSTGQPFVNSIVLNNATQYQNSNYVISSGTVSAQTMLMSGLKVGDYISVRGRGNGVSLTYTNGTLSVTRMPGSSPVLQASQSVQAIYYLSAGITTSTQSVVKYDFKVKDSTNSYNPLTGLFTCPISGTYRISVTGGGTGTTAGLYAKLNGTTAIGPVAMPIANAPPNAGSASWPCLAGQTLAVYDEVGRTLSGPSGLYGPVNMVTFERTGN